MIRNSRIVTYNNLKSILSGENGEPLVCLNDLSPNLICRYNKPDMAPFVGEKILVRKGLASRLIKACKQLKKINPEYSFKIVYGYRHPTVQIKYFNAAKEEILQKYKNMSDDELFSLVHNLVAVPSVAGHTVGGAIDITIEYKGGELDMGTKIADFEEIDKVKTFSKNVTDKQLENRLLLHDLMIKNGFAPFYGEWWHFSYGDKEWAYFYKKKQSLYSDKLVINI